MTSGFSSNSDRISEEKNNIIISEPTHDLVNVYELERCVEWLKEINKQKVCLQFPDNRLIDSVGVCQWLHKNTGLSVYILGDTSYGSCCIDVVAAEHIPAEAMIHFGPACLSNTSVHESRIPVLFVFPKCETDEDVNSVTENILKEYKTSKIILLISSCEYSHLQDRVSDTLHSTCDGAIIVNSRLLTGELGQYANPSSQGVCNSKHCHIDSEGHHQISCLGRGYCLPEDIDLKQCDVVFLGDEDTFLHCLLVTLAPKTLSFSCFSSQGKKYSPEFDTSRVFRRQCYLVQQVREASTLALVLASPGDPSLLPAVRYIRKLIRNKCPPPRLYALAVGKPNPPKLANFPEVEVFVLLACPLHPLLAPASSQQLGKEFYRPIVGLAEVEMAFNLGRPAAGPDFRALIPGGSEHIAPEANAMSSISLEGDVSLLTNRIIRLGTTNDERDSGIIAERFNGQLIEPGAAGLANRTWQGLDPELGAHEPVKVVQGRSGIAASYNSEPNLK